MAEFIKGIYLFGVIEGIYLSEVINGMYLSEVIEDIKVICLKNWQKKL